MQQLFHFTRDSVVACVVVTGLFGKSLRLVSKEWSGGPLIFTLDYSTSGHSLPPVSPAGSFLAVTTSNNVFAWYKSEIRFNKLRVLYEVDCQPAQGKKFGPKVPRWGQK